MLCPDTFLPKNRLVRTEMRGLYSTHHTTGSTAHLFLNIKIDLVKLLKYKEMKKLVNASFTFCFRRPAKYNNLTFAKNNHELCQFLYI